jgi:hypothetical protein
MENTENGWNILEVAWRSLRSMWEILRNSMGITENGVEIIEDPFMGELSPTISKLFGITAKATAMGGGILVETTDKDSTTFIVFDRACNDILIGSEAGLIGSEAGLIAISLIIYTRCYLNKGLLDPIFSLIGIEFNYANAYTMSYLKTKHLCLQALINEYYIYDNDMVFFDSGHNDKVEIDGKTIIVSPNLVRAGDSNYLVCISIDMEANTITTTASMIQVETITSTNSSSDLVMEYYQRVIRDRGIGFNTKQYGHTVFQFQILDEAVEAINAMVKEVEGVTDSVEGVTDSVEA